MMPWCHGWGCRPTFIASHIHIGFISSVVAPFNDVHGHMSAPLLYYTVTRLGHILAFLGHCQVELMPWCHGWGCRPPFIASTIHIWYISSILAPFNDGHGHIHASLYCYTDEAMPDSGNSEFEWNWCHDVMVEAVDHLWLLLTSILDIYKVL